MTRDTQNQPPRAPVQRHGIAQDPWPSRPCRGHPREVDYATEIARLDALSRKRALTDAESLILERCLMRVERKRAPRGNTKELARAGVKHRHVDYGERSQLLPRGRPS